MQEDILSLAKKFISVQSVSGDKPQLKKIIEITRNELEGFNAEEFESNGIPSLLFSNHDLQNKHFKIILNAHLDVVSGNAEQYSPDVKNGRLYGRGAYDMKATAAVMIYIFKEIAKSLDYPLGLQITVDEEIGGVNGTKYQLENGVRANFAITGEGTNFRIINEAKARMILKILANGKNSHSAYPWLGDNAIMKIQKAVTQIAKEYPQSNSEWNGTTVAITSIGTNNLIYNKIPDHCEAILDARVIADEKKTMLDNLKKIVNSDIQLKLIADSEPHHTNPDSMYIEKLRFVINSVLGHKSVLSRAHGESDARFFTSIGCEGVEFGPIGGNHHADEEWVDLKSLEEYYTILKGFIIKCKE